ncbi:MAG: hypothetical protein MJ197_10595, partial [Bacteroidales bacterium]|nr:hypothetical protein [Bacteroidales bacterium]
EAYTEEVVKAEELHDGDIFKSKNGTVKYRFCGLSDNGKVNAVNIDNGCFTTVGGGKYRVIERL